jgi:hypothetical protein
MYYIRKMKRRKLSLKLTVILGSILFIQSCAPSRVVRPLNKGERQVSANLGGPLFEFAGTTIPLPLTAISYAQGVSDKVTVFGGLHTTAMLYGVFQTDIGACINLYHPDSSQFGLSVNPVINMAYDKWEGNFKLWPVIDVNAYWEFKKDKSFTYIGISNWFELASQRAHGVTQENRWLINPHLGVTYLRQKWNYNIETKWLVPNVDTQPNVVDYKGVNGMGAIGIYFTFTRKF